MLSSANLCSYVATAIPAGGLIDEIMDPADLGIPVGIERIQYGHDFTLYRRRLSRCPGYKKGGHCRRKEFFTI